MKFFLSYISYILEFREKTGARTDDYSEPPHPEVNRADVDISRHPTSPPSSPGEEAGRQRESDYSSDSSTETESEDFDEDLPDDFDLSRWRAVQPCTDGPPHCCEKYYYDTVTEEEERQLVKWEELCLDQIPAGERLRPDIEEDKTGKYPFSVVCSLLREIRS